MPDDERQYEAPELIWYGDLRSVTLGTPIECPVGTHAEKFPGQGDDIAGIDLAVSPFVCAPG